MAEWQAQARQPSYAQVLRQLKRRECGVYNCINSVLADAAFVREVAALYPGFPVLANLRCGLWYVPEPAGTCYFKSTDGHFGKWAFSLTRLNTAVARLAAQQGGVLVVDATRRGKTFPDALAKTVPIWAAVLNRAVAVGGQEGGNQDVCEAGWSERPCAGAVLGVGGPACDGGAAEEAAWDTELHLPPWVSATEQSQIELRLDTFVRQLLEVSTDVPALAAALHKPLRPLWVSQRTRVWLDAAPDARAFAFTPLVLVSASLPGARQRCVVGNGGWSYEYVPGAGDDEESWARGLTPALLMRHRRELVDAGPEGVEGIGWANGGDGWPHADDGIAWLPGGSVGLGAHAAGAPETVWRHADAVLNLGMLQHHGMQFERMAAVVVRAAADEARPLGSMSGPHAGRLQPHASVHLAPPSGSVEAELALYLWLPVAGPKQDRVALRARLPAALAFVAGHLARGRRVLVHCDDGTDRCVCVAVAALLAG
ncbi:hypothetical protein WJX81_008456 [Elliptochloris bilobata]|uniref:Initiator tRNA phosphoribosyl transferase n=1 Tax=Elliptochloris bilobata TaxID=381761 RepID=A0AAW1SGZ3_9CHLO